MKRVVVGLVCVVLLLAAISRGCHAERSIPEAILGPASRAQGESAREGTTEPVPLVAPRALGTRERAPEVRVEAKGAASVSPPVTAPLTATSTDGLSLSGEVIGFAGFRVPLFSVQATPKTSDEGAMTVSARTDERGRFLFTQLPLYAYRVGHVYHSRAERNGESLVRPPMAGLAVFLRKPTLRIRFVDRSGDAAEPDRLLIHWAGKEERSPLSSQGPPMARFERLEDETYVAILDEPGSWALIASLNGGDVEQRAVELLTMGEEHRELDVTLDVVETREVVISLVDSSGDEVEDWTAKAWHADYGLSIEESPMGSHRLELPVGHWNVRVAPTNDGYVSAFDADVEVKLSDSSTRIESVRAPRISGRFGADIDGAGVAYHFLAVHESGARHGFKHQSGTDGAKWRTSLLRPGSYAINVRRVSRAERVNGQETMTLDVQASVESGRTTLLDLSLDLFRP